MVGNMSYWLVLLGFMAVSGAHGQCDQNAMMACVGPLMDMSDIGTPAGLERICGALDAVGPCIDAAGCSEQAAQFQETLANTNALCENPQAGVGCDQEAMLACIDPLLDMSDIGTPAGLERVCGAVGSVEACISAAGCSQQAGQFQASLDNAKSLCADANSGPMGTCDPPAMQKCFEAFGDLGENPTAEQIGALCESLSDIEMCISDAGCAALAEEHLQPVRQQCAPREGATCSIFEAIQCAATLDGSTSDREALCTAFKDMGECLTQRGCSLDDIKAQDTAMEEGLENIEEQCSGTTMNTVSMLTLLAASLFIML